MKSLPNLLTSMRLVLALFMFVALAAAAGAVPCLADRLSPEQQFALERWAVIAFVAAAVTDFFDGWLARKLNATSVWGAILDSFYLHTKSRDQLPERIWPILVKQVEAALEHWHEPDRGMPGPEGVREEEEPPGSRGRHEERHSDLDDAARVVAVGRGPAVYREQQEGQPVRDDRESGERGRMEFLEDDPVADHVLDGVGHHHRRHAHEEQAKPRLAQGGERSRRAHVRGGHGL